MKDTSSMPLDVIFLLLLVPAQTRFTDAPFMLVIPLFIYVLLELWHPLTPYSSLPARFGRTRLSFLARFFLLLIMIVGAAILPAIGKIYGRLSADLDASGYSLAYADIHDGAVQVESALLFLSNGRNPYVERYEDTPLKYYGFAGIDIPHNPAIDHLAYLPGLLLASFPPYLLFDRLGLPYDQRWIYLTAYAILVLMLPVIIDSPTGKLSLLSAVALNPLLTGPVILGMNDVIVAVTIFVAVFALSRRRFALSALCFGMACTFKQSAWFAVPFYIVLLYRTLPEADRMRNLAKYVGIVVTVLLVIVGPFVLWDPPAFVTDVLAYPSGRVPLNYPIRGYTLGALLVGAGLIPSPLATFPFWIFQCLLGLPLLAVLLKYQWHHQGIGPMMLCSGIFIFGMGLLSRFFQDNYVGFVTIFMTMGILAATPNGIRRLQHEEC